MPGTSIRVRLEVAADLLRVRGWLSIPALADATGWTAGVAARVLRVLRLEAGLDEHVAGSRRAWALPGEPPPPLEAPRPHRPRRRRDRPPTSRSLEAYRMVDELGVTWAEAAAATGFASGPSAARAARRIARREGLAWPLLRV